MKSLLCLSFEQTDLSLSTLQTKYNHQVYHDIYDRIVRDIRQKIKTTLSRHQTKLILRTIYLLRTKGAIAMLEEICGDISNNDKWNISIWRLSMVYSVVTIKRFKTKAERLNDIIENIEIVLPPNDPHIPAIYNCINKIIDSDDPDDLNLYIDTYMAFGPKIVKK